jgi:hypothetical protein
VGSRAWRGRGFRIDRSFSHLKSPLFSPQLSGVDELLGQEDSIRAPRLPNKAPRSLLVHSLKKSLCPRVSPSSNQALPAWHHVGTIIKNIRSNSELARAC